MDECLSADPTNAPALILKALAAMDLDRFSAASSTLAEAAQGSFPCARTLAAARARLESLQGNETGARGHLETLRQNGTGEGPGYSRELMGEAEVLQV